MDNKPVQELPMKWHHFLIYFALWIGALYDLSCAVLTLTGHPYGPTDSSWVYGQFPGLRMAEVIYSVLLIGMAIFGIYTRFQLAGLKKGAPAKFLLLTALDIVLTVGFQFVQSWITNTPLADLTGINTMAYISGTIIGLFLVIWIMKVYYGKRAHLFVN